MIVEDQTSVIDLLLAPGTHGGADVERVDTHTAVVFLAGGRAFKLKRAVRFDYVDFSTEAKRRTACEAELRVNRRMAPAIYRAVVAVTRAPDGRLALGGRGEPIDWVVEMARFDQAGLLDRLAAAGTLHLRHMRPLADVVATFHDGAPRRRDHGGSAGMQWVVDGNADGFHEDGRGILDAGRAADVTSRGRAELDRHAERLDRRRRDGFVRECHGDLHLGNIVLLDGRPTLFDAIEFNEDISCIDTLYDVAFLLMDLCHRGLPAHANAVFNGYVADTGDVADLAILPLLLSCRAAVRAKTSASAARVQEARADRARLESAAREYLTMAGDLLESPPPHLVAIGGLSGSGKSTLAMALAPHLDSPPGALVLRSDEIRKVLCGVGRLERLGAAGYAEAVNERVYETVLGRAVSALAAGRAVVADALFSRPRDREAIERVAARAGVPFTGIWLTGPPALLIDRVKARRGDPSDADEAIVRSQLAQPTGRIGWQQLDASLGIDELTARIRRQLPTAATGCRR
jgi:hypothetical protein